MARTLPEFNAATTKFGSLRDVPSPARELGLAGLLPFVGLSAGLWLSDPEWAPRLQQGLLLYGALILSFMGAVHWGLAMARNDGLSRARLQLGLSVTPALVAWFAFALPVTANCLVLAAAFVGLWWFDLRAAGRGLVPSWYPALRTPLTAVVAVTLVAASLHDATPS